MWHFLKANNDHARGILSKEEHKILLQHLRVLYYCSSEEEFKKRLKEFNEVWKSYSSYLQYFKFYWMDNVTPAVWASYARGPKQESGDNILEAWHFKAKSGIYFTNNNIV